MANLIKGAGRLTVDASGTDSILPWFIIRELPIGVAGLVVAGIFAAAQSTISASMSSVASVIVTDFYRRMFNGVTEYRSFILAKVVTAMV